MEMIITILNFDIDGVVRDVFSPIKKLYNSTYNPDFKSLLYLVKSDNDEVNDSCINSILDKFGRSFFYESKPYPNSVEVINSLYKNNTINFVSSQFKRYQEMTYKWLKRNGFNYDNLVFTNDKSIVDADFLVDDFICKLNNSGNAIPICRSHFYNKKWKGRRINSLDDLVGLDLVFLDDNEETKMYYHNFKVN